MLKKYLKKSSEFALHEKKIHLRDYLILSADITQNKIKPFSSTHIQKTVIPAAPTSPKRRSGTRHLAVTFNRAGLNQEHVIFGMSQASVGYRELRRTSTLLDRKGGSAHLRWVVKKGSQDNDTKICVPHSRIKSTDLYYKVWSLLLLFLRLRLPEWQNGVIRVGRRLMMGCQSL